MKTVLLLLSLILICSCSKNQETRNFSGHSTDTVNEEKVNRSTEFIPEPDILIRLKYQKAEIDSLISRKKLIVEVYAKIVDVEKPVKVENQEWPGNMETTFNIWKDPKGTIKFVGEYPISESGDWFIGYNHYFDQSGNTFAFERITNFYNSICTDGAANETITDFYNKDLNKLVRVYLLKDENGKDLIKEECVFNYDYPYDVIGSLGEYFENKKIFLSTKKGSKN